MKKRSKSRIWLLLMVLSLILCVGCGTTKEEESSEEETSTSTLIYASQDYTAINPALYEHGEINLLIFAGLTSHDENNQVVPALAESWTFDEETLTYTFYLREGLTFHDGEPLTSSDVEFTLEAILDEENQSEIISNYTDIVSISCPDDLTVEITLSQINAAFPDYMSIGILPKHLLEGEDLATSDFNQNPVGAGPYKLTSWDMGQSITLESFDNYYAGKANIDTVIFRIVPDVSSRVMLLQAGEVDMAQITAQTVSALDGNDSYTIYCMDTADYRAIAYNFNSELFSAYPELANILSYAIDREAIVESVLLGQGEAAYSPLQKSEYNNEKMETFSYDPEKCKELLEADGWSIGSNGYYEKDGVELAFTIYAMADDDVRIDMAVMCAAQLQEIGVNATAKAQASLDWVNQDACIIGWGSPFDPDDHTYKIFTTDAGDNYTYYSNEKVDAILAAARQTEDEEERQELYAEFLEAMTEAMPYTFIAYIDAIYAINSNVTGITENTVLGHHGVGIFWNIAEWEIVE